MKLNKGNSTVTEKQVFEAMREHLPWPETEYEQYLVLDALFPDRLKAEIEQTQGVGGSSEKYTNVENTEIKVELKSYTLSLLEKFMVDGDTYDEVLRRVLEERL